MMSRLTTQNYWEGYYAKTNTQRDQIERIVSVYDKFWDTLINENEQKPPKTIIEIGGYPGRYLAYLANKYNLLPTSLDFNSDIDKIAESMKSFEIENYNILQADIFEHEPLEQYDIVISNGFIEHFENYDEVLDRHKKYLKKGGTMLVMIPNKRWLRKWYGLLVDYNNLKAHNLKSMKKSVFFSFAKRNDMKIISVEYFGGFSFSVHQKLNVFQKLVYIPVRYFFKRYNSFFC